LEIDMKRSIATTLSLSAALLACTSRGPVDRSLDSVHATNRTVGESAENVTSDPSPSNVIVDALTFPFRLIGRVGEALFGP
jgi:hypothetical protein